MSRHQQSRQQPRSTGPNWRTRTLVGGAAMTAVLLGGAGTAMAHDNDGQRNFRGGSDSKTCGIKLPAGLSLDTLLDKTEAQLKEITGLDAGEITKILALNGKCEPKEDDDKNDRDKWKNKHRGDWHKGDWNRHDDDCDCDDEDDRRSQKHDDCDEDEDEGKKVKAEDDEDDEDDDKDVKAEEEKADDEKDEDTEKKDAKAEEEPEEVEAAKADESTPEVKDVAVEDNSAAGDVPVGSANTGDGSFVPGVGVAPVANASSWSMADSLFAAGGGVGAVALLAGAGVGVGRHRRGSHHRASV